MNVGRGAHGKEQERPVGLLKEKTGRLILSCESRLFTQTDRNEKPDKLPRLSTTASAQRADGGGTSADVVEAAAQIAYLARDWCGMKAIELARWLHPDASMISRLCAEYEAVSRPKDRRKNC